MIITIPDIVKQNGIFQERYKSILAPVNVNQRKFRKKKGELAREVSPYLIHTHQENQLQLQRWKVRKCSSKEQDFFELVSFLKDSFAYRLLN